MGRLFNLGSLCIDRVYSVPSLSVAGSTISSTEFAIYPGGKGLNQSLAAARAGATVTHCGCVGADGTWLRTVLTDGGVKADGVLEVEADSGHAVIQVDSTGQNAIVIVGGANRHLPHSMITDVLNQIGPDDWLLLQNEINDLDFVLAEAKQRKIRVAFNIAPVDGREHGYDLSAVSVLIVNEIEAAALSGIEAPSESLAAIVKRHPELQVVLTLGRDGLLYGHGAIRQSLSAQEVDAVDETAAGDAFIGYFMASILDGKEIEHCLHAGSVAGAYAVTVPGAAVSVPTRKQFQEFERNLR